MSIVEKFVSMDYGPAPEDPAEAMGWLDGHNRRLGHFIKGAWQEPSTGQYFDTMDPSTGERLATVAQGGPEDVDAAVEAARQALAPWQGLTPHTRSRYPARRQAFLLPRRMGAATRARISRLHGLRRCRADHSLEFSIAHAGMEDCAGIGDRKHRHPETGRV